MKSKVVADGIHPGSQIMVEIEKNADQILLYVTSDDGMDLGVCTVSFNEWSMLSAKVYSRVMEMIKRDG